jgi:ribose-phosphate pyrophosphokinase
MPPDAVVVSLDLGAARLAERYGRVLEVPVAMVEKTRLGPRQVEATEVIGDVRGRSAVIVDDMISTGGTIDAAARALMKAGSRAEFVVAATHGIFAGGCKERFDSLPVSRLLTTDSLQASPGSPETETVRVAPLLAEAIIRVHREQPVSGLAGVLT